MSDRRAKLLLIGLVGFPGSGKESALNFLHYSYGFLKINFSDKVKEVAHLLGKTDRASLQTIRHGVRELFGEEVWIDLLKRRVEEELLSKLLESYSIPGVSEVKSVQKVVIGDIKYGNELDFVRCKGGLSIGLKARERILFERLKREDFTLTYEEFKRWLKHPSEVETPSLIDKCDFVIDTDEFSIRKLEEKVDQIVRSHFVEELRF
jgi:dephospho-CoA kinase